MARNRLLDLGYGWIVFLLNCHSFIDVFYALGGGFSTALVQAILESGPHGVGSEALVSRFAVAGGGDKIYAWRMPHLQTGGYLRVDTDTGLCSLTAKGLFIARCTLWLKRAMHLREGG